MKKILILLIFIGLQLNGQELFHRTLDSENGLPSNKVHYVFEDSKGYIWFGTENGVARWDSKNWGYYSIKDGLPNNEVLYIFEDSKRRIWFSTFSNELCYLKNDTIFNRKNDKRLEKINIIKGGKLTEYKGDIFFFNYPTNMPYKFDLLKLENRKTGIKVQISGSPEIFFLNGNITNITTYPFLTAIWRDSVAYQFYSWKIIANQYSKYIKLIDYNANKYFLIKIKWLKALLKTHCKMKMNLSDLCNFPIDKYTNYEQNINFHKRYYTPKQIKDSSNFKIELSNKFSGKLIDFDFFENDLFFIFQNYLITNKSKTIKFDSKFNFLKSFNDKLAIITESNCFFITSVFTHNYKLESYKTNSIHKLFFWKNNLHILYQNGKLLNLNYNKLKNFDLKNKIYNLDYGAFGNIYITTYRERGIFNINSKEELSSNFPYLLKNFKGFSYSHKYKLYTINNSSDGLYTQNLHHKATKISDLYSYTSFIDSKDRLWVGTVNKLYLTNKFLPKVLEEKEVKLNNKFDVFCSEIKEDNKGNIFFTTNDGLYIIDKQNRKYHLSDKNYLSSNELVTLKLDTQNQSFFVASRNGVNQLKYTEKEGKLGFVVVNKFFKDDGLSSNEIKDVLIDGDSLWVATAKGLDLITNKRFRPDTLIIPLHINRVYVNDSIWRLDSFYQLKHNQNNIKIDYSAIYYQRRDRLDIRYRLIEDGDTTSSIIENSVLQLFSLAPGKYTLQLYVYDKDYPYIKSDFKMLNFQISPPYYKTGWFYIFIILLTSLILTYILRIRYIRDREKLEFKNTRLELEKNLSKFKLEALKAEMNPHFIFNCLNSIKDFILREETEKSQYYLSQLSKLIRIALYNTKEEFISLRSEIEFIELYIELEQLRFQEKFVFKKIIVDKNLLNAEVPTMVLQPFFENAIRHGKIGQLDYEGKILLEVRQENDFIVFNIKDNGIGLSKAAEIKSKTESGHKSMAIDIIKDRIKIYNQSFNLDISLEINEIHDIEYKSEVILKYILD